MCKQDNADKCQLDDQEISVSDIEQAILDSRCSSLQEFNWIKIRNYLSMGDFSTRTSCTRLTNDMVFESLCERSYQE